MIRAMVVIGMETRSLRTWGGSGHRHGVRSYLSEKLQAPTSKLQINYKRQPAMKLQSEPKAPIPSHLGFALDWSLDLGVWSFAFLYCCNSRSFFSYAAVSWIAFGGIGKSAAKTWRGAAFSIVAC